MALDMITEKKKQDKKKKPNIKPVELSTTTFDPETMVSEIETGNKLVKNTNK